jgi:hypothetical protein
MDETVSPDKQDVDKPSESEPKPNANDFVAPEAIADKEDAVDEAAARSEEQSEQKERFVSRPVPLPKWLQLTKKQWIIVGVVLFVLVGGATGFALTRSSPPPKPTVHHVAAAPKKAAPTPTTVPSTLTGLPVAPSVNKLPVTAVMIENSTFARPQSGLDQAGVVFEAIAEGGITRFVALFQDTAPSYIGPVRSIRPYYLSWLDGFDAIVAHVGGSPEAIHDLTNWNIRDMNQAYHGSYFTRITSREAPHNVYTSIARLNALETSLGDTTSTYTGFLRKAPSPSKSPNVTTVNFNISYGAYNVQYKYNATNNTYERFEGGAPHMVVNQAGVQTQIAPTVVVAMIMPNYLESDGLHNVYGTVGSGAAYVFQDGTATLGTWKKTANNAQITFTDSSGKSIRLDDGYTWLTALGQKNEVTYN